MKTIYAITEDSANYTWEVFADSEAGCLKEFKRMWRDWCKHTGAERDYWGKDFSDVWIREIKPGAGYMDKEVYK